MGGFHRFLRMIVRNDAMASDPEEVYGWRVFLLAVSSCFGAMSFGWDSAVIGGVMEMPPFKAAYGIGDVKSDPASANRVGTIVSLLQAGCLVGSILCSPLADRFGRRLSLLGVSIVLFIGVAMQASAAGKDGFLAVGRFIAGIGVGSASVITPTYVSENAPRGIRGLLTGVWQLFILLGAMIAFWLNYGAKTRLQGRDAMYILPLALQALPAVLLFSCMLMCNESPRWYANQDRWEDCTRVLSRIRNLPPTHPYIQEEIQGISDQLEDQSGGQGLWAVQREMWTVASNRKRVLLCIALMALQQLTGTNAISIYAPTIFKSLGAGSTDMSLLLTGVYGVFKVLCCTLYLMFLADSLGRRGSLLWTSIAQGTAMMYIALCMRFSPPQEGEPLPPQGYLALVCIYLFSGFFQVGWGPVCWTYAAEIPTLRMRALNLAYTAATQWIMHFIVARFVPTMLSSMGKNGHGAYLFFACFCYAMFFLVWKFVRETKGLSTEEIDQLFGGSCSAAKPSGGSDRSVTVVRGKHVETLQTA